MKILSLLGLLALSTISLEAAPLNLSQFAGTFNGTTALTYAGSTFSGSSTQRLRVKKKGLVTILKCLASVAVGTNAQPAGNVFTFGPGRAFRVASAAPAVADVPITGSFRSAKRTLVGTASYVGNQSVIVQLKLRLASHRVVLTTTQSVGGGYRVTYSGTKRVP